jgi:hypothetical protein
MADQIVASIKAENRFVSKESDARADARSPHGSRRLRRAAAEMTSKTKKRIAKVVGALGVLARVAFLGYQWLIGSVLRKHTNGRLVAADCWRDEPAILGAGMGFDNIIGLRKIDESVVREAGGSWYGSLICAPRRRPRATSTRPTWAVATAGRRSPRPVRPMLHDPEVIIQYEGVSAGLWMS